MEFHSIRKSKKSIKIAIKKNNNLKLTKLPSATPLDVPTTLLLIP